MLPGPGVVGSRRLERVDTGYLPTQHQGVNSVGPLVGRDRLEVEHVPDSTVLRGDAVTAQEVARTPRHVESRTHVVPLGERDPGWMVLAFLLEPSESVG